MKRANGTGNIVKLPGNRRKPWVVRVSYWDTEAHESFARLVEAVNSIPTSWVGIQVGNKQ